MRSAVVAPIAGTLVLCCALAMAPASADTYSLTLTREDANLYKDTASGVLVETKYCYEYVYSEPAVLAGDKLVFLESGATCDVAALVQRVRLDAGDYPVSVTKKGRNRYKVESTSYVVQTSMCLELALMDDAILHIEPFASKLVFLRYGSPATCDVKAVHQRVPL